MFLAGKESQYTTFTPSVKQFHGTANLLSEPSTRISQHWTGKTRANPSESDLYEIETLMKRKLRLLSTEQQRNGIPISSHGDKYYKEVDAYYEKASLLKHKQLKRYKDALTSSANEYEKFARSMASTGGAAPVKAKASVKAKGKSKRKSS